MTFIATSRSRGRVRRPIAGWLAGIALLVAAIVLASRPTGLIGNGEPLETAALRGNDTLRPILRDERAQAPAQAEPDSISGVRRTPVVEAVNRVTPSVVSVNVIRRTRVVPRSIFEEFFSPYGTEREVAGLGSGFAYAAGGYVLTNAHVVAGAIEIVVSSIDGSDYPAELIGIDELSDLALLKVDTEIPVPEFGNSDQLVIGEPAIAIGNPFGYLLSNVEPTITVGVISGLGRHILPIAFSGRGQGDETIYADMIQTDASINPGNSGGPLVDAEGRVVGVTSAIFSRSGGSQGLGFAIPINRALGIAEQLRSLGEVRRPWVGLDVGSIDDQRAGRRRGAAIIRVSPESPAERANLEPGMELIAVNGRPVKSPLDWEAELFDVHPGEALPLTVRDAEGVERQVTLQVEELPSVRAARLEVLEGLELVTLTAAIRAERALRSSAGALIVNVSDYVSRQTGLRQGDLIVAINRRRVESADAVAEMIDYLAGRGAIRLHYERNAGLWSTTFRIVEG